MTQREIRRAVLIPVQLERSHTMNHRLAQPPPTRTPLPPDPAKAIADICKALGLPPDATSEAITIAVQALLGSSGLTTRQLALCRAKGIAPADFKRLYRRLCGTNAARA